MTAVYLTHSRQGIHQSEKITSISVSLVRMVGERQRHAVAQRLFRHFFGRIQQDASIATIDELRIKLPERLDQIGLAVKVERVAVGLCLDLIDPDGAAALAFAGEVTHLAPFEGFFKPANAIRRSCGIEDQAAKGEKFFSHPCRIAAEGCCHFGV